MSSIFINPRLNDYLNLPFSQDDVDFAIPHLIADIPLSLDPFLLWSSSNQVYKQLHDQLLSFFEHIREFVKQEQTAEALQQLTKCGEPRELGLGFAKRSKRGSNIGIHLASSIVSIYEHIPQVAQNGLKHIEEIQLVVPGIAADRISDLTYSILKEYFINYTIQCSKQHNIPTKAVYIANVFDFEKKIWRPGIKADLPYNPLDHTPIVFAPLNMLRHLPWISYEDYYKSVFSQFVLPPATRNKIEKPIKIDKTKVLAINRNKYARVQYYVDIKEKEADKCKADSLSEKTFVKQGLTQAMRSLMILEKQAAGFGSLHIPVHLAIQIEDKKKEVEQWETRLSLLGSDVEAA